MHQPKQFKFQKINDERGSLVVIDKVFDFEIKRIFYIYGVVGQIRGGHAHKRTRMALFCVQGSVKISIYNGSDVNEIVLDDLTKSILLEPYHWHTMNFLEENSILFVCASEHYDKEDYLYDRLPWK